MMLCHAMAIGMIRGKETFLFFVSKMHVTCNQGCIALCKVRYESVVTRKLMTSCLHHASPLSLHVGNLRKSKIIKDIATKHLLPKHIPNSDSAFSPT